jgi:ferredoxin
MDVKRASLRYFTGTGNSKRIADICAEELAAAGYRADVAAISEETATAEGASLACFCFPVYSLDLPRIAKRYLESLPLVEGGVKALLLVTGGDPDDFGWSLEEGRRILCDRGYDLAYADIVHMPNNWTTFSRAPDRAEASSILEAGEAKARAAARAFVAGERFVKPMNLAKFGPFRSRLVHAGFKLGVKRLWKLFRTSEDCNSCGFCARACPTGSIAMEGGRPVWSASCEQCLRCFNLCPSRAIMQLEFIGRGSERERWMEPHFKPLGR